MNIIKIGLTSALFAAAALAPAAAHATLILDTGVPTGSGLPVTLDSNDFYAAEFTLGAGQTITGIEGYITAGSDQVGATFTVALYSASGFLGPHTAAPVYSGQASYTADGWNGLSNLSVSGLTAGNYWAAFEVGSTDNASALMPLPGANATAPALAYAFNAGSGYTTAGAQAIGAQVDVAPVPLPAAIWLLGSGILGLGAARRRRA